MKRFFISRRGCLMTTGGAFMLLLAFAIHWLAGNVCFPLKNGEPLVVPDERTTVITDPLDINGDPDYIEYLNRHYGDDVSPGENAVVQLLRATGPTINGESIPSEFYSRLGTDPIGNGGPWLNDMDSWQSLKLKEGADVVTELQEAMREALYGHVHHNPWTAEQFPEVAGWLDSNQIPLEHVWRASMCPKYYQPLVTRNGSQNLLDIDYPMVPAARQLTRVLTASVMFHLGEGEIDAAMEDVMTMRRWARLIGSGSSLYERLTSRAIDQTAMNNAFKIIQSGELSRAQLNHFKKQTDQLGPLGAYVDCIDVGERMMALNQVILRGRGKLDGTDGGRFTRADYSETMLEVNEFYDEVCDLLREDCYIVLKLMKSDILDKKLVDETLDPASLTGAMFGNRKDRGRAIGKIMVASLSPATNAILISDQMQVARDSLLKIVFSLEEYRAVHSKYPDSLDALTPDFLDEIPRDPFSGTMFLYGKNAGIFQLYSVGVNRKDDGGNEGSDNNPMADDIITTFSPADWEVLVRELRATFNPKESPAD